MKIPLYQADAFANAVFRGNPAAVCPLDAWLPEAVMQAIAAENNLAETAFFVPNADGSYHLRWFTPEAEVSLCGHATLASAFVLYDYLGYAGNVLRFQTLSGELRVEREAGGLFALDFPARASKPVEMPSLLAEALGAAPAETFFSHDRYLALYKNEEEIRALQPDFRALEELEGMGVIVTAAGNEYDFVSRFFAPNVGVDEDPVTGSAHSTLIPFWAKRLDKAEMRAYQASRRGGEIFCVFRGKRVGIKGYVAPYLRGEIEIP